MEKPCLLCHRYHPLGLRTTDGRWLAGRHGLGDSQVGHGCLFETQRKGITVRGEGPEVIMVLLIYRCLFPKAAPLSLG